MLLSDILTPQRVKIPLQSSTKPGVITEMVDLLTANGDLTSRDRALAAVLEREQTRTTGIGNGLAIPHGKTSAANDLVLALGVTAAPVDFDSIDNKPVSLLIMVISPMDQTGPHIQALAHISRLLSHDQLRKQLLAARSSAEAIKFIKTFELVDR